MTIDGEILGCRNLHDMVPEPFFLGTLDSAHTHIKEAFHYTMGDDAPHACHPVALLHVHHHMSSYHTRDT